METYAVTRSDRAEARHAQIVQAARECFQKFGFHGASMAQVATTARMSVGQIYRFFPSKESIIAAIVEEQAAKKIGHIAAIEQAALKSNYDLADPRGQVGAEDYPYITPSEVALHLEIIAEAARNPAVAAILGRADALVRQRAEEMIALARPHWPPERVSAVYSIIAVVFDGSLQRQVSEPEAMTPAVGILRARLIACAMDDRDSDA